MLAPITRIALRYGSMALVMFGLMSADTATALASDPDIMELAPVVVGALSSLVAEGWYFLARRFGWSQ